VPLRPGASVDLTFIMIPSREINNAVSAGIRSAVGEVPSDFLVAAVPKYAVFFLMREYRKRVGKIQVLKISALFF
jgi:hypothetical protein